MISHKSKLFHLKSLFYTVKCKGVPAVLHMEFKSKHLTRCNYGVMFVTMLSAVGYEMYLHVEAIMCMILLP